MYVLCICMYIYLYMHTSINVYVYINRYVYIYKQLYISSCVYIYMYTHNIIDLSCFLGAHPGSQAVRNTRLPWLLDGREPWFQLEIQNGLDLSLGFDMFKLYTLTSTYQQYHVCSSLNDEWMLLTIVPT